VLLCYLFRFFHASNFITCTDSIVNASTLVYGNEFNFTCCCVVCFVVHCVALVCVFDCLASYKAYAVPPLINALKSITYHFYPMIFVLPKCYLRLQKCYLCYLLLLFLVLHCSR
jgi:hypothetical protein